MTIVMDLPEPCVCQTMPPLAASYIVYLFDAIYCGTNEKELLVSGNFFDAKVKDDKAVNEFQQTLWTTQIVKTSILFRDQSVSCAFKRGKVRLRQGEVAAEQSVFVCCRKGFIDAGIHIALRILQFVPNAPECL